MTTFQLPRQDVDNDAPAAADPRRVVLVLVAAALAALACGMFVDASGYVWLAAAAATLGVGVAWPLVVRSLVSAELHVDGPRPVEHVPVGVRLVVRSRWPLPLGGLRVTGPLGEAAGEVSARPGVTSHRFTWTPGRFGVTCGDTRLTYARPFGLLAAGRKVHGAGEVVVWPATHPVGPVPDVDGGATGIAAGRRVGQGGEMCGVRDFRRGDQLRAVHWQQTARHDRLVVRETVADATPRVRLALRAGHDDYADAGAFDDAVRMCASRVVAWTRAGAAVDLLVGGRRIGCPPNRVPRDALDLLASLTWDGLDRETSAVAADVVIGGAS